MYSDAAGFGALRAELAERSIRRETRGPTSTPGGRWEMRERSPSPPPPPLLRPSRPPWSRDLRGGSERPVRVIKCQSMRARACVFRPIDVRRRIFSESLTLSPTSGCRVARALSRAPALARFFKNTLRK